MATLFQTLTSSDSSEGRLDDLADAFERDVRWRFKLLCRAPIEDSHGRATDRSGGWSGILRHVEVAGESVLLKTWPALAMLESFGANLAQMALAHDSRWLPLTMEARVRHHRRRTRELLEAGVRVPRLHRIDNPKVLALEYLENWSSLAELTRRHERTVDDLLVLYAEAATALRRIHEAETCHGEPGAGNILVEEGSSPEASIAFVDFEAVYKPHLTSSQRRAFDLRYFALQQAARLAKHHASEADGRAWDETAESALRAIYDGYGASPLLDTVCRYSQTGATMLYEAWGTLFTSLDKQRRVQTISDRILRGRPSIER